MAGEKEISLAELGTTLSNRFGADADLPVYISESVDRDTLHGDMVARSIKAVRAAGIQNVAFITDSKTEAAP